MNIIIGLRMLESEKEEKREEKILYEYCLYVRFFFLFPPQSLMACTEIPLAYQQQKKFHFINCTYS